MKVRVERGRWDDESQDAGIRDEGEGALGEKGRRPQTPRLDTQETRRDLGSGQRHEGMETRKKKRRRPTKKEAWEGNEKRETCQDRAGGN